MAIRPVTAVSINDHQLLTDLLSPVLNEQGLKLAASFAAVEPGIAFIVANQPALVLIDSMLPMAQPGDGKLTGIRPCFQVVRDIQANCPQTKILVLSGERHPHHFLLAFEAGATGIASKLDDLSELASILRQTMAGHRRVMSHRLRQELAEYQVCPFPTFTDLEIRILELAQSGLNNAEIGQRLHLSRHTIKNILNTINQKLGTRNRIDAYERAEEMGIIGWRW